MPTTLTNGIQLPDKGSVDWYSSMQSNYNLIDTHLGDTDAHVTAEDKVNWNSKQGSLSQAQLDAIAQVATNTSDISALQSGKADASHTHSSSDITDIGDYATKQYVDNSISGLVDNAPDALNTLNELSAALNDDSNFASTVTTALGAKANSSDLATVATSGSYTDLTDKPTINDSTITIQKNGSTVDTFTTNGSNKTINIPVPTKTSDLTNDSDFVVSSSLATVATSGDYDDLSNKPSIPTNTSDLNNDSGFVTLNDFDIPSKTSDLTNDSGFITSSDVPTGTSDLINDSNFVDTSNAAVASGITSSKVTDYDTHIADTDIHVTTADKNKWNNNTYVFRYSSTALVASSTNSNTLLDNTDNLKVGDKVIDSDGVLFSITAIDTANSTFTIGTALIDLAQDSDVVHKSGNETVGGVKTFTDDITVSKNASNMAIYLQNLSYDPKTNGQSGVEGKSCGINFLTSTGDAYINISAYGLSERTLLRLTNSYFTDSQNVDYDSVEFSIYGNGARSFRPRNTSNCDLGESNKKWKGVYAANYYYGSNNVEFSTKFVTTDTAQTITGAKTFSSYTTIYNSDTSANTPNLILQSSKIQLGDTSNSDTQSIVFNAGSSFIAKVESFKDTAGTQNLQNTVRTRDTSNNVISAMYRLRLFNSGFAVLESNNDNTISLGRNNARWKDCQTYLVNGVEPSSLSLPDLTNAIDISSYITDLTGSPNVYSSPANGYIVLRSTTANVLGIVENTTGMGSFSRGSNQVLAVNLPVVKNSSISIYAICSSLTHAKFIPCQGNV